MKVDRENPGEMNKNNHERLGSLGVFKLLTSHLLKESEINERTLRMLDILVCLLERSLDLDSSKHDYHLGEITQSYDQSS